MVGLKVSVTWDTPTTYAGEELRCTITFRNAAPEPIQTRSTSTARTAHPKARPPALSTASSGSSASNSFRREWPTTAPAPAGRASLTLPEAAKRSPGHRQTASLSATSSRRLSSVPSTPVIDEDADTGTRASRTPKHSHKRSISIVSHGSVESGGVTKDLKSPNSPSLANGTRRGSHTRAASYHGPPTKTGVGANGVMSPKLNGSITNPLRSPRAPPLVRAATAGAAKTVDRGHGLEALQGLLQANEEEDLDSAPDDTSQTTDNASSSRAVSAPMRQRAFPAPLPHRDKADKVPLQRVISPLGIEVTPRSSLDLMSNFSEDTFASEYPQAGGFFRFGSARHSRQNSALHVGPNNTQTTEHLMMGYVQLSGSFILDSSLVNLSPFEEVKQMGVIGGQDSGGVVGVGTPKRTSGLFGSFGLPSLGSFGGILGGQDLSSIREMKGQANTKSIPLISTPQSILFVDLELRPGQSKTFTYRHKLPQDLPPTHRGRAIKIEYQITVGTQRAHTVGQKNNMRRVDVPFRVFPGLHDNGSLIVHNLMKPHVFLEDQSTATSDQERRRRISRDVSTTHIRSRNEFLAYTDQLLQSSTAASNEALLSPTRMSHAAQLPLSSPTSRMPVRDIIEQTVNRPMLVEPTARSPNQFAIQRAGSPIAVISLVRPIYRLGETVTAAVDLTPSAHHVFVLHASLESEEIVAEDLALRSAASIRRATRRVHAHNSEQTASVERAVFQFMVPWNATPEFSTSGVRLEWRLRVEFICSTYSKAKGGKAAKAAAAASATATTTEKEPQGEKAAPEDTGSSRSTGQENILDEHDDDEDTHDFEGEELLEEVSADDRSVMYAALQEVHCESFEVAVPIRVLSAEGGAIAKTTGLHGKGAHVIGSTEAREFSI